MSVFGKLRDSSEALSVPPSDSHVPAPLNGHMTHDRPQILSPSDTCISQCRPAFAESSRCHLRHWLALKLSTSAPDIFPQQLARTFMLNNNSQVVQLLAAPVVLHCPALDNLG